MRKIGHKPVIGPWQDNERQDRYGDPFLMVQKVPNWMGKSEFQVVYVSHYGRGIKTLDTIFGNPTDARKAADKLWKGIPAVSYTATGEK
jgi:hypothetical protein